jgi:hypothetical protein
MRIKPIVFGILVIAIFFGTLGATMAAGIWQTTGRSASTRGAGVDAGAEGGSGESSGSRQGAGGGDASGDAAGAGAGAGAVNVKGRMAIGDVAAAAGVDLPEILASFGLAADTPPSTAVKDLESDAFSVAALRTWLAERGADPAAPSGGSGAAPDGTTP